MTQEFHLGAMAEQWLHTHLPPFRAAVSTTDPIFESWYFLTNGWQFTVQNLNQVYVLVSSAHKTTLRDMTYTILSEVHF